MLPYNLISHLQPHWELPPRKAWRVEEMDGEKGWSVTLPREDVTLM